MVGVDGGSGDFREIEDPLSHPEWRDAASLISYDTPGEDVRGNIGETYQRMLDKDTEGLEPVPTVFARAEAPRPADPPSAPAPTEKPVVERADPVAARTVENPAQPRSWADQNAEANDTSRSDPRRTRADAPGGRDAGTDHQDRQRDNSGRELERREEAIPLPKSVTLGYERVHHGLYGRISRAGVDFKEEASLEGQTPAHSETLGVVVETIAARKMQIKAAADAADTDFGPMTRHGTDVAERVAKGDLEFIQRAVEVARTTPTGLREDAINVAGAKSKAFNEKLNTALQGTTSKEGDNWLVRHVLRNAPRETTDRVLDEAKEELSLSWFTTQASRYTEYGEKEFWEAMERQPDETGGSRRRANRYNGNADVGEVQAIDKVRDFYGPNHKADGPTETPSTPLDPAKARNDVWKYRVVPLDKLVCDEHPAKIGSDPKTWVIGSDRTLRRGMIIAAADYDPRDNAKAPRKKSEDGTERVLIRQSADGLFIDAIKRTRELMEENFAAQAWKAGRLDYVKGVRPSSVHPEIAKITALEIDYISDVERQLNGREAGHAAFLEQVRIHTGRQMTMQEVAMYSDPADLADLLMGMPKQRTNEQLEIETQRIGAEVGHILATQGPAAALEHQYEATRALADRVLGIDMAQRGEGIFQAPAGDEFIAGHLKSELDRLDDPQKLSVIQQQIIALRVQRDAAFGGVAPAIDPLRRDEERLGQMIAALESKTGAKAIRAAAADVATQTVQQAVKAHAPDGLSINILSGPNGDPAQYTGLIAALANGAFKEVVFEGKAPSPAVLKFCNDLAKLYSADGTPIVFREMERDQARNKLHGLRVSLDVNPPHTLTAEDYLDGMDPDSVGVIPIDAPIDPETGKPILSKGDGWSKKAGEILDLMELSPDHRDKFEKLWSSNSKLVTARPPKVTDNQKPGRYRGALVIAPYKQDEDGTVIRYTDGTSESNDLIAPFKARYSQSAA